MKLEEVARIANDIAKISPHYDKVILDLSAGIPSHDRFNALLGTIKPAEFEKCLLSLITASGEACVCDLTEPLGLSQPTVSHHLKVLTDAGLLAREQRGRWAFFRLQPHGLDLLRDALAPS